MKDDPQLVPFLVCVAVALAAVAFIVRLWGPCG